MRRCLLSVALVLAVVATMAGGASAKPSGRDGQAIQNLTTLIRAGGHLEGIGPAVNAIAKFKAHKANN
jgi:hypothetical protein